MANDGKESLVVNNVKEKELKKMQGLACDAGLEIRQVIDTLDMLVDRAGDIEDKDIALRSTPCILIMALGLTLKKIDEVWGYLYEVNVKELEKLKS